MCKCKYLRAALCEHSPHYGARLPRQRFITSASVPSSPSVALSSSPPSESSLRHSIPVKPVLRYLVNLLHLLSSAAMHDSPSSPRRSIAPAPPKQHQAKKAGAPKAKGAVRAKSGCYTCRIRRKVCAHVLRFTSNTYVLTRRVPRNAMNGQTQRVDARHASASAFSALALGRSAPSGSRYVRAPPSVSWGSHRVFFSHPFLFNRKTIMSPSSVRRSRISWRRRE